MASRLPSSLRPAKRPLPIRTRSSPWDEEMRIQRGCWGRQKVREEGVKENLRIDFNQLSGTGASSHEAKKDAFP